MIEEQDENLRRKRLDIIKDVFTKLINNGIGIIYFKHCGYYDMGLTLCPGTTSTLDRIPFSFEEEVKEKPYFPKDDPDIPKDLASINTKSNVKFIPALTSILYSN